MGKVNKLYYDFQKLDQTISKKANLLGYNKVEFLYKMGFGSSGEMYYRQVSPCKSYISLTNNAILKIEKHCGIQRLDYLFDEEKHKQESQRDNHSAF